MGSMAKGVQAIGTPKFAIQMPKASTVRTDVDILKLCRPMGTMAANWKKR
jgi:hypothetical protein